MTVLEGIKDPLGHGRVEVVHRPYFWKNKRSTTSSVHLVNQLVTFFVTPFITLFLLISPFLSPPLLPLLPFRPLPHLLHNLPHLRHQENKQTIPFLGIKLSPSQAHNLTGRLRCSSHPHGLMTIVHLLLHYHLTSIHLQVTEVF